MNISLVNHRHSDWTCYTNEELGRMTHRELSYTVTAPFTTDTQMSDKYKTKQQIILDYTTVVDMKGEYCVGNQ